MIKLSPSSAARRVACPGSRALEDRYRNNEQSPIQREGSAAHWVAAEILNDRVVSEMTPAGEIITDEMVQGGILYRKIIKDIADNTTILHIEESLDISIIHPSCSGTPDCWFIKDNELHIFDYKYGYTPIEAFENWQLIEYAAGISSMIPVDVVNLHIVQPRDFSFDKKTWRINFDELEPYFARLRSAEAAAAEEHALTQVNDQCVGCRARHACAALRHSTLYSSEAMFMNTPIELDSFQIGGELRILTNAMTLMKARIAALEEQATAMLKQGKKVPYWALQESAGRLIWKEDNLKIKILGELLGIDLTKALEVITPRQAESAGVPSELINSYCERKRGALKLTLVDDNKARKIFG